MRFAFRIVLLGVGLLSMTGLVLGIAQPRPALSTDFSDETSTRLAPEKDRSFWVRAGDIDKDGDLDLIVGNRPGDAPLVKVLANNGQGKLEDDSNRRIPSNAVPSQIPFSGDLGDIDGDGDLDLVLGMASPTGGEPDIILVNTGNGLFQNETATRLTGTVVINRTYTVGFCDVDSDNDLDLYVGTSQTDLDRLWVNQGRGVFVEEGGSRLARTAFSIAALDCGDADSDGDNDLVLGTGDPGPAGLTINQANRVFINSNRGFFADETAYRLSFEQGTNTTAIKYLDVDGDKDLDVFACNDPGRAVLWINNGKGFFDDRTEHQLPFGVFACRDLDYADFDGDGDLDIALARAQRQPQEPNLLLQNDGRGHFVAIDLPGAWGGNGIAFVDLNGDKKPDIYIARGGDNPADPNPRQDIVLINKAMTSRP